MKTSAPTSCGKRLRLLCVSPESDDGQNGMLQGGPGATASQDRRRLLSEARAAPFKNGDTESSTRYSSTSRIVSGGLKFHCCRTISRNERPPSGDHRKTNSALLVHIALFTKKLQQCVKGTRAWSTWRDQFVTIRSAHTLTEPYGSHFRDCENTCKHADLQKIGNREEGLKIRRVLSRFLNSRIYCPEWCPESDE
jgi:hypothetical protein